MMAFTNFFYVINDEGRYLDRQWDPTNENINFLDGFLTTYLISLGDFSPSRFDNGPDSLLVWFFFLLATFMMLIVFMNLLITIIGNKFDEEMEIKEQSTFKERASMLVNFDYLMNIEEMFKNKKYIISAVRINETQISQNSIEK